VHVHRGFSLVELVAGLAVAGVLAALAAPAFEATLADSRRTAAVNALVRAVHGARVAAITRGVDVAVCPSRDGRQCSGDRDWAVGFLAFANRDRDQPPRVDADEPVLLVGGPYPRASILANRASFVLRPPGRRSVNGTFVVCDARGLPAARVVVVSPSGRPRTAPAAEAPGPVSCSS
jgi:type IV fimbrial biogenesis protein FimT